MDTPPGPITATLSAVLAVLTLGCGSGPAGPGARGPDRAGDAYAYTADLRMELAVEGGLAGVSYAFEVDGASGEVRGLRCGAHCPFGAGETVEVVTARQVATLANRLVDAGLLALDRSDFGTLCCDQLHYTLRYSDGTVERTVQGSSEALPEALRVAIGLLHGLGRGIRPVLVELESRPEDWPRAPVTLRSVSLDGPHLTLEVTHVGGCWEHVFDLVAWNGWLESYPVQMGLLLAHDDRGDSCEAAAIAKELVFDLEPLRRAYERAYRSGSGTIILQVPDPAVADPDAVRRIEYSF